MYHGPLDKEYQLGSDWTRDFFLLDWETRTAANRRQWYINTDTGEETYRRPFVSIVHGGLAREETICSAVARVKDAGRENSSN
jgi:hypothetical protein